MAWTINGQIGTHGRSGTDAWGWLWELQRDEEARRVLVEVAGTVWAIDGADGPLPNEVRRAIETEGRSEIERVAALDDPPRVVACTTAGCIDRAAGEAIEG